MTQRKGSGTATTASLERVWQVPDAQVASGRIPGYVAAVRVGGAGAPVEVHAGGRTAVETGSAPMGPDTLFRLASVTKPIGAALALSLVQGGVLALDAPIAQWLPEMGRPRVLISPDAPWMPPPRRSNRSPSGICSRSRAAGARSWTRPRCRRR
jgi:CubicO group peptidase (beta-lactamase class C family)